MTKVKISLIVALILAIGLFVFHKQNQKPLADAKISKNASASSSTTGQTSKVSSKAVPQTTVCSGSSGQKIIVSISKQHMWACQDASMAYDNPVVTGMQQYPSELTPIGTYKIYGKLTDQTLAGSDFTGHWSDYVYYWMPFLTNKYGTYGFHDLTASANGTAGRQESDFGKVDINAPYTAAQHGSHGCVEMPLTAAKWLYNWAPVGTSVTVQA